jgi:hypothetical protein
MWDSEQSRTHTVLLQVDFLQRGDVADGLSAVI